MRQTDLESSERLEAVIYRMVRRYAYWKSLVKLGMNDDPNAAEKIKSGETAARFREAQQKLCSDAFLGFRSRRDDDFVSYFTDNIGSVSQYLPEDDYRVVAAALMRDDGPQNWRDVKTLAMLALSAASYTSITKKETDE